MMQCPFTYPSLPCANAAHHEAGRLGQRRMSYGFVDPQLARVDGIALLDERTGFVAQRGLSARAGDKNTY